MADIVKLDESQNQAVQMVLDNKISIITGPPGTGKTTVCLNVIASMYELGINKDLIRCACPTGKAAKRLSEQVNLPAETIHRLLEYNPNEGGFTRTALNPIEADMLIVDEMSMVDIDLFDALLYALPFFNPKFRLVMVGDVDQLPSVGPGNVLSDLIESKCIPFTRLRIIHRQHPDSWICHNAQRINRGEMIHLGKECIDFFWVTREDSDAAADEIVKLASTVIPKKHGINPINDIQVLSPQKNGAVGVIKLNEKLQAVLNPKKKDVKPWYSGIGEMFSVGDKVIHIKNNYILGVMNGESGIVIGINRDNDDLIVNFGDRKVFYGKIAASELRLAFALTIHKYQGSELPCIVMPIHSSHHFMLSRSLFYTGVTRGKKLVYLVGDEKGLKRAIKNNQVKRRYTMLRERLELACGKQR